MYSGEMRLNEKVLRSSLGENKFWFIGSCFDIFAKEVPKEWIHKILCHCRKYNNKYLFQTKNPIRILTHLLLFPKNVVFGTTVETNRDNYNLSSAPSIKDRLSYMTQLSNIGYETCVTIEPIVDFDLNRLVAMIQVANPDFVNIGANTNRKVPLDEPPPWKIKELVAKLEKITTVKIKKNLNRLMEEK
jgi:DNA repair photolyase